MPQNSKSKPQKPGRFGRLGASCFLSTTIGLLACLIALDAWLTICHPLAGAPVATLDRGEIFCASQAYRAEKQAPDVVLLGSSLMTAPVIQADTTKLNEVLPRFAHRRSFFLQEALGKRLPAKVNVFSLAVGGEMASDAYLITKHLLAGSAKPSLIVWGIAPRDFQDNLMPGVDSSETFHVLASADDLPDLYARSSLPWERKVSIGLERFWALWRYHNDIKTYLTLRGKKLLEACLPWVMFDKYGQTMELKPRRHGQFPEEAKGTPMAYPGMAVEHTGAQAARFEYIRRYNPPSPQMIASEFTYFERLLALCQKQNINLLVINMPLSQFNKSLMPPELYASYLQKVEKLSKSYDAEFFDFNLSPWDDGNNFVDTVHLSPEKSGKFLDELADVIARSSLSFQAQRKQDNVASAKGNNWH